MSLTSLVLAAHQNDETGYLTIPLEKINTSGHPKRKGPNKNNPYFFVKNQGLLDYTKRHCRIYRGGFLDYTVKGTQFFETFEDWIASHKNLVTENMIHFGFETDDVRYKSINISEYFRDINEFEKLKNIMKNMDIGVESIAIVSNNKVFMATTLM
jgi:hypothetical protein